MIIFMDLFLVAPSVSSMDNHNPIYGLIYGSVQRFRPWTAIIICMVLILVAPSVFVLRRP
jgi:hypothetical protein